MTNVRGGNRTGAETSTAELARRGHYAVSRRREGGGCSRPTLLLSSRSRSRCCRRNFHVVVALALFVLFPPRDPPLLFRGGGGDRRAPNFANAGVDAAAASSSLTVSSCRRPAGAAAFLVRNDTPETKATTTTAITAATTTTTPFKRKCGRGCSFVGGSRSDFSQPRRGQRRGGGTPALFMTTGTNGDGTGRQDFEGEREEEEEANGKPLFGGEDMLSRFQGIGAAAANGVPRRPPPPTMAKDAPSKADLYSDEELANLLNIHNNIADEIMMSNAASESSLATNNPFRPADTAAATSSSSSPANKNNNEDESPSLHDLVLKTIQNIDLNDGDAGTANNNDGDDATSEMTGFNGDADINVDGNGNDADEATAEKYRSYYSQTVGDDVLNKVRSIRVVVSDVDGTLLSPDHALNPITKNAIFNAAAKNAGSSRDADRQDDVGGGDDDESSRDRPYFFVATGKTPRGAWDSLGDDVREVLSRIPGVYVQGLYCIDGEGNVVYERKLTHGQVRAAERIALKHNVSMFGYDGNDLYRCASCDEDDVRDIHDKWGEPTPVFYYADDEKKDGCDDASSDRIPSSLTDYPNGFHKCFFMNKDENMMQNIIRPEIEGIFMGGGSGSRFNCTVTSAYPSMLEVLPPGCSKAEGVLQLCKAVYNITDLGESVMSIGDQENDIDMLRQSAIGIAVGNAADTVKDVCDVVMKETSDEGGAGIAIELFGLGKIFR